MTFVKAKLMKLSILHLHRKPSRFCFLCIRAELCE